jgi:hypothetical protein
MVAIGAVIGTAVAVAAARVVSAILYRVSPADPLALMEAAGGCGGDVPGYPDAGAACDSHRSHGCTAQRVSRACGSLFILELRLEMAFRK